MKKILLNILFVFIIISIYWLPLSAQNIYTMCLSTSSADSTGILYDSGGPNDNYQNNENCTLLIAPPCATSITLSFQHFDTESGFDSFHVYDGNTTSDPELLVVDGNIVPGPVTGTSGSMLIVWISDHNVSDTGFACSWNSVISPSLAPAAAFSIGNNNPPMGTDVYFTDETVGPATGWLWYFGDGDTSQSQNPIHIYSSPGTYTVTLISFHCSESDTVLHSIDVQAAPQINVAPASGFTANLTCGDSETFFLNVGNTAGGQLVYNMYGPTVEKINLLVMTYGTSPFVEFPRTIAAINQYFTNYTLTITSTIDPSELSGLIAGKNVLLIPEQQFGLENIWIDLGSVIRKYLSNGGSVVFCGSSASFSNHLFNTGVFTGSFAKDESGLKLDVLNITDPLTKGLSVSFFIGPSSTYSLNITNPDKVSLVKYGNNDVVAYSYFGLGKAIYVGFDFYNSNPNTQRIIANAVEWGGINALPPWISLSILGDTINAGQVSQIGVTFLTSGFPAGTYFTNIGIENNDPDSSLVFVPCSLTISGLPNIKLSTSCLAFGQVMQHTTARDTFSIINDGCDTLFISNIDAATSSFGINANFGYLLPGSSGVVEITFYSSTVKTFEDTIYIQNNDVDTFVCLSATTFPAPIVNPSANILNQNIRACNESGVATFNVTNSGGSNLIFQIGNLPSWITSSSTSDTLSPSASSEITLNFSSEIFSSASYQANIHIISNDPLTPDKVVSFVMNVDSNPCIDFTSVSNTCTGYSNFTSISINTPTTYHWDFGDGDTSNIPDPIHGYAQIGTYTAVLRVCNSRGCDTAAHTINTIITGPKPASCNPETELYCCGIGIILFQITDQNGFLFNKTSPDAVDSYKDYSCTDYATMVTNVPYNINITTGFAYDETVKAWLDMNNDGIFDTNNEQIYLDSAKLRNHSGTFTIPSLPTNVYGEALRLRLASDYSGNPDPHPCQNPLFGQVEDYSVLLTFYDGVNELFQETAFNVYPSPFEVSASIEYHLIKSSIVSVEIFNIIGEKVETLCTNAIQSPGKHSFHFGKKPSGVYFVKLSIDGNSLSKKIIKL